VRDVSPPSSHSGDDQGDDPGTVSDRPAGRRGVGPRHLATGDRSRGVWDGTGVADTTDNGAGQSGEPTTGHGRHRGHKERNVRRTVLEWAAVIGGGVLIALTLQAFFVQAFWIPSPSMSPTLEVGDRVLVNKLSYKLHDVHRGDVVVFERPPQASNGEDGEIKDLIKRVVAVGGDTLEARDGQVYVNGERIEEPYLEPGTPTDRLPRQEIPEGFVFVMGDNRTNSEDSRVFGPIDEESIVGRAFVKVLPITDLGWL
jgi:signal peptidase I